MRTCVHAQRRARCGCTCQSCSSRKDGRGSASSDRWKNIKSKAAKVKELSVKNMPPLLFLQKSHLKSHLQRLPSCPSPPSTRFPQEEPFSLGGRRETLHHDSEKQACHIPKLEIQHTAHVLQTCSNNVPLLEENRPFLRAL